MKLWRFGSIGFFVLGLMVSLTAQERFYASPEYARYREIPGKLQQGYRSGALTAQWDSASQTLTYRKGNKTYRFDIGTKEETEIKPEEANRPEPNRRPLSGRRGPARGGNVGSSLSPDSKQKAFIKDRNLWISDANDANPQAITIEGSEAKRIRIGAAPWVYREELSQNVGFWWSPDNQKIAYYRFDESQVPDYYLTMRSTAFQNSVATEPYPKAGGKNPVVDLFVYDLKSKKQTRIRVRDSATFEDSAMGYYVYHVEWSPDGKELLFYRTNRLQNTLEFTAANPNTGRCRVIVREENRGGWVETHPTRVFLQDNKRFIWSSERNGYRNYYLYDLSGKFIQTLTNHSFEVERLVEIDEKNNRLFYMARSGDNPYKLQLHRVGLDGQGDTRLTDPAFHHRVTLAPNGSYFVDIAETHNQPPVTRLIDSEGKVLKTLAESDLSGFESQGGQRVEMFTFKAADGETTLYGRLMKPSNFDPNRAYPLLVMVYNGPESSMLNESFTLPSATTELGYLVAAFDTRGGSGRGREHKNLLYRKLGVVEIDDLAAGVRALRQRAYVDSTRVGVQGTSYGGYASVMCLLRYPDLFQAACASSSVTDWRHYDTIYTERYMDTPQANEEGYNAGSAVTYASRLKGRLMLFFGTADDNVHPANSLHLASALRQARKSFEMHVGADMGHAYIGEDRMLEFFMDALRGD